MLWQYYSQHWSPRVTVQGLKCNQLTQVCWQAVCLLLFQCVPCAFFSIQDCILRLLKRVKGISLLCLKLCVYVCSAGLDHLCWCKCKNRSNTVAPLPQLQEYFMCLNNNINIDRHGTKLKNSHNLLPPLQTSGETRVFNLPKPHVPSQYVYLHLCVSVGTTERYFSLDCLMWHEHAFNVYDCNVLKDIVWCYGSIGLQ